MLEFYQELYAPVSILPHQEVLENRLLGIIPPAFRNRFPAETLIAFGASPDILELRAAVHAMATGKSPGPDGVVVEFFRHFWDLIGPEFTHMIQSAVTSGVLPNDMNKGLIALLPKAGDLELLPN